MFVKPGYAWNDLVPKKKAFIATDHRCPEFVTQVNVRSLALTLEAR